MVALPRDIVSEEDMAIFAANAARVLADELELIELPESGTKVPIVSKPEFIYSGNDDTHTCKLH